MRQHGFQPPYTWTQGLAVVLSILTTCFFCCGTLTLLPTDLLSIISAVYSALTIFTVALWGSLTASNPTDSSVNGGKWCDQCQLFVNTHSWHCRQCQRCVFKLDHHCKWLNNCIGQVNYRRFVSLCATFLGQNAFESVLGSLLLAKLAAGDEEVAELAEVRFPDVENALFVCALLTAIVVAMAILRILLLFPLIFFHVYLRCHGFTTFTYIVQKSRKAAVVPSHIELDTKPNTTVAEQTSDSAKP